MSESAFGAVMPAEEAPFRQPIGRRIDGRYVFFKVRRFGKLQFEKRIADEFFGDLKAREALRKEFELGFGLEHQGIVRYLDCDGDAIYEEFVDGLTLREMLLSGDRRLADAEFLRKTCRQLLDALDYLHKKGIVHLDIKPENVMITTIGNRVKIIDLGAARSSEFDRTEGFTPDYMAPEQARGVTGIATDIYLVGRLMAEPAGGNPAWQPFIAKATAANPALRFKDCREAIKAIPAAKSGSNGCATFFVWIVIIAAGWIWWSERSDRSSSSAVDTEFNMAVKNLSGNPTPEERTMGMKWMLMAAENGSTEAQCYLGLAYRDGLPPLSADTVQAIHWLKMAAHKGNDIAREALAELTADEQ